MNGDAPLWKKITFTKKIITKVQILQRSGSSTATVSCSSHFCVFAQNELTSGACMCSCQQAVATAWIKTSTIVACKPHALGLHDCCKDSTAPTLPGC
jgi:hypothetical protein